MLTLLDLEPYRRCTQCLRHIIMCIYIYIHDTSPSRALCHCAFEKQQKVEHRELEGFLDCCTHLLDRHSTSAGSHGLILEHLLPSRQALLPQVSSLLIWKRPVPWSTGHTWILQHRWSRCWSWFHWSCCCCCCCHSRWCCSWRWSWCLSWKLLVVVAGWPLLAIV